MFTWDTKWSEVKWSRSVASDSLWPHGQWPTTLLRPWDFPGKRAGVGYHFHLQRIFLTQGSNPGIPHFRQMLYVMVWATREWLVYVAPSPFLFPLYSRTYRPQVAMVPDRLAQTAEGIHNLVSVRRLLKYMITVSPTSSSPVKYPRSFIHSVHIIKFVFLQLFVDTPMNTLFAQVSFQARQPKLGPIHQEMAWTGEQPPILSSLWLLCIHPRKLLAFLGNPISPTPFIFTVNKLTKRLLFLTFRLMLPLILCCCSALSRV